MCDQKLKEQAELYEQKIAVLEMKASKVRYCGKCLKPGHSRASCTHQEARDEEKKLFKKKRYQKYRKDPEYRAKHKLSNKRYKQKHQLRIRLQARKHMKEKRREKKLDKIQRLLDGLT